MAETVEAIAKRIQEHCEKEIALRIPNRAFGRSNVLIDGAEKVLWLTGQENLGSYFVKVGFGGDVVDIVSGAPTTLREDGEPVYKNTTIGGLLIKHRKGKHPYKAGKALREIEIINSAKYSPHWRDWAIDLSIQLASDDRIWSFRNLRKLLEASKVDSETIAAEEKKLAEAKSEEETRALLRRIEEKKQEHRDKLAKAQTFIRTYAELRYQPILDPQQETIKREELFGKTMVINGGPGTGKTTTLIQRIKFLLDLSDKPVGNALSEEDRNGYLEGLSVEKRAKLKGNLSWMFFSPSELLKLFLQNAMSAEGLDSSAERVKVWSDHKAEMIRTYGLVNHETQRPFLFYKINMAKESLLPIESEPLKRMVKAFMDLFLKYQTEKLSRLTKLDFKEFEWKALGNSIKQYIIQSPEKDINGLLRVYYNLNLTFATKAEEISSRYSEIIKVVSAKLLQALQKDPERLAKVRNALKEFKEAEPDEEQELDIEVFVEETEESSDFDLVLLSKFKSLIRKQALSRFDKDTRNTVQDKALLDLLPELKDQPEYSSIGQLAYFKKFVEKACKGVISNVYRDIPMLYKRFRKTSVSNNQFYGVAAAELVRGENKRIHEDEQAFMLYMINRLVGRLQQVYPALYASSDHPYIRGHKQYKRNIIAIDEATDFHLIDLLAIRSFGDRELFSLTLSGDLMQRMTSHGIRTWESIETFVKDEEGFRKEDLVLSYRQSPTLLDIAQNIFTAANKSEIHFRSFIGRSESEPKPLRFQAKEENEKVAWLTDRILEIYKAYDKSIPSIAIFTKDDEKARDLERAFQGVERLTGVGILVKACNRGEVLGNENTVRIFAIQYIKGLEFEAVFFHNIDELSAEPEMLYKYLYVALSRATFYLAVTHSADFSGPVTYLNQSFTPNQNWKLV